jgi:hypothetical protein
MAVAAVAVEDAMVVEGVVAEVAVTGKLKRLHHWAVHDADRLC